MLYVNLAVLEEYFGISSPNTHFQECLMEE